MIKNNVLTILVPTYNRCRNLKICLESIDVQTVKNFNVIIGDDASSDNTYAFLKEKYQDKTNLHFFTNNKNLGLVKNLNEMITLAQTEWVTIVQDDDFLDNDFVETILDIINRTSKKFIIVNHRLVDENNKIIYKHNLNSTQLNIFDYWNIVFQDNVNCEPGCSGISSFVFNLNSKKKMYLKNYYKGFFSDFYLCLEGASINGVEQSEKIVYNGMRWSNSETRSHLKHISFYINYYKAAMQFKKDLKKLWCNVLKDSTIKPNLTIRKKILSYYRRNYMLDIIYKVLKR